MSLNQRCAIMSTWPPGVRRSKGDDRVDEKTIAGLLGLLAHDLRNPLSALHSNMGFLAVASDIGQAEIGEVVADALVSCDGLLAIIDNIEILSQSMTDPSPRAAGHVSVASTVAQTVAANHALAKSHEVAVQIDPSAQDTTLTVWVNRDMYRRALANVLRNAIQHSAGKAVRLVAQHLDDRVQVLVIDQGSRLDATLGDEPFTAAGQLSAKNKAGARYGRGLGLYCARFAATTAGAELSAAESPAGSGNAFVLTAPINAP